MKKQMKRVTAFLLMIILLTVLANNSYAENKATLVVPEKSQEFKNWEKSTEEDKKSTLPKYTDIKMKDAVKKSTYRVINNEEKANLEAQYRRTGLTVKNQKQTNMCWAFSFSSVLERKWCRKSLFTFKLKLHN